MIADYVNNGNKVGSLWVNCAVCCRASYYSYDSGATYKPIFISVLGQQRIVQAAWKGLVTRSGEVVISLGEEESSNKVRILIPYEYGARTGRYVSLGIRPIGEAVQFTLYDAACFTPWVRGQANHGVYLFGFGATEEAARNRFFRVLDKTTTIPLWDAWVDDLWMELAQADGDAMDCYVFGDPRHTGLFKYTKLVYLEDVERGVLEWLERRFVRKDQEEAA